MRTTDMKGIYSALLVSFDKEGNINEKGLRQIIRHNIDVCKVDGLYVGGSTGENFMLSTDEKKRIFEIAKDEVKEEIKLIAQVGSINVYESLLSKREIKVMKSFNSSLTFFGSSFFLLSIPSVDF